MNVWTCVNLRLQSDLGHINGSVSVPIPRKRLPQTQPRSKTVPRDSLSCCSVLALCCLSTRRHMSLKLAQRGCFSSKVNSAILVMRNASPPSSPPTRKSAAQCQDLKWNLCYSPWGKMGFNPALRHITLCHSKSAKSLKILKLLGVWGVGWRVCCFIFIVRVGELHVIELWGEGWAGGNAWHVFCQWKWRQLAEKGTGI